jgi:metal-dependent hydrolase (beta-lactamase superfamily II)
MPSNSIQPPSLRNINRLGIDPSNADFVHDTHPHADHLNGSPANRQSRAPTMTRSRPTRCIRRSN